MSPETLSTIGAVASAIFGAGIKAWMSHGKKLKEIEKSVNGKDPDEPTLREMVKDIFDRVPKLEEKLDEHTAQDAEQFGKLADMLKPSGEDGH